MQFCLYITYLETGFIIIIIIIIIIINKELNVSYVWVGTWTCASQCTADITKYRSPPLSLLVMR